MNARAVLLGLAIACSATGCTRAQSSRPPALHNVLRLSYIEDVQTLNPHLTAQQVTSYLSQLTMAYLVRSDARGNPRPELATAVPSFANGGVSHDGLTVTYHLRRNARWSDGAPFTATDVVFSTHVTLDPANNEAIRYGFEQIAAVDAPDAYTVRLHLKRPFAPILVSYFATALGPCILPQHLLGKTATINNAAYNALPVGIGPFKYVSWKRGDAIDMIADPLYFRGRPKLDRVIYKIMPDRNTLFSQLQTHDIDLVVSVARGFVARINASPGVHILQAPIFQVNFTTLNVSRPLLRDVRVRRALQLANPRAEVLRTVFHGMGTIGESYYPASHPLHLALPAVPYNIDAARKLLDAAGWHVAKDGVRVRNGLRLSLEVATGSGLPDIDQKIELMRSSFHQAGIELVVHRYLSSVEFGPIESGGILATGKFDIAPIAQGLDPFGDLSIIFACDQVPPRGYNQGRFCDRELDRAMKRMFADFDLASRRRDAAVVQRRIAEMLPVLVENYPPETFALDNNVKNFAPNPVTPLDDMMNVEI